jgi:murein endopeptidase
MARPLARYRLLLAALLVSAALPARTDVPEGAVPSPRADPRTAAQKKAQSIKDACEGEAVAVRLDDPASARDDGAPPKVDRPKEAQSAASRLGKGVEGEPDAKGQTLSWKRDTTKDECRVKLRRLDRDFPDRITFEPTTEERVAEVRRRRDALIPERMRKDAADASVAAAMFDGDERLASVFGPRPGAAVAAPARYAAAKDAPPPVSYAAAQLPIQYQGPLSKPVPALQQYSAPSFYQRAVGAYEASTAYVSSSLDAAGRYVTGVARGVQNRFYSGIEMIQGYGYTFIHAGRSTNWGTKPLVDGLRKIAAYMRGGGRAETDLAIGDISSVNGGQLGGHASHQRGRDVDIGFYMTDESGKPATVPGFVRFTGGRDGLTGYAGGKAVRFDAQRNWFLVQAILANDDPAFRPTNIFIDNHLKNAILAAAGPSPERARAQALMSYWPGHDNHLHLRVQ